MKISVLVIILFVLLNDGVFAQEFRNDNIVLTNPPEYPYGVNINIDTNSPERWAREFNFSYKSKGNLFSFGTYANGSNLIYGYIGGSNPDNLTNYQKPWMVFKPNGDVGLGVDNPMAKFHIYQQNPLGYSKNSCNPLAIYASSVGPNFLMNYLWVVRDNDGGDWFTAKLHDGIAIDVSFLEPGKSTKTYWERHPYFDTQTWGTGDSQYMTLKSGMLGIGTTTPEHKLDVVGTVRAHQVLVNTQKGADFVFADRYNLRSLEELEQFISEHKHLPEVASANTMIENGVDMGELQIQLLQKIEELTLYIIKQDKKINELESKINNLTP